MSFENQIALTNIRIGGLIPSLQSRAYALLGAARYRMGIYLTIVQGTRAHEEQSGLYAKGRTAPGESCVHDGMIIPIGACPTHPLGLTVTRAKAGQSNHEYGQAFDVAELRPDGRVVFDKNTLEQVGPLGEQMGLRWGGRWSSPDRPHFEDPSAPLLRPPLEAQA